MFLCIAQFCSLNFPLQWLSMPHNFVYLGIYFTIAKCMSSHHARVLPLTKNSLCKFCARHVRLPVMSFHYYSICCSLNLRNWYRHRYIEPRPLGILKRPIRVNTDSHVSPGTNSSSLPQIQPADLSGMLPQVPWIHSRRTLRLLTGSVEDGSVRKPPSRLRQRLSTRGPRR
jgi:hypothetical protein